MVVYIDVLFILNLVINYFILLAVSQLLHRHDKRLRLLAGAALGAIYATLIFFPQLAFLYTVLLKLVFSITIVAVAFKSGSIKNFFKLLAFFYVTSMLFGGVVYAVEYFLAPSTLAVKNGVAYMDISPLFLILTSAGCYVAIKLFSRVFHRDVHTRDIYKIKIETGSNSVNLTALLDNGNDLREVISGLPVIIAEYVKIESLIPKDLRITYKTGRLADMAKLEATGFNKRFYVVPYGSVAETGGVLPAFRPDRITVEGTEIATADVIIAVTGKHLSSDGQFSALLNPALFTSDSAVTAKHADKILLK
jgi:stage II sporulation protein GA (sporulation sigma-E factor processing peptidase)